MPITLRNHWDADGICTSFFTSFGVPDSIVSTADYEKGFGYTGGLSKDDWILDMKPDNPKWGGHCIDHHLPHDESHKYELISDDVPATLIAWRQFKDKIPKSEWWKISIGLCVHGNSSISTLNGAIPARSIKVGDELWSWTGKRFDKTVVKEIMTRRTDTLYELVFKHKDAKRVLKVTGEHPILRVDGEYIPAKDLKIGEEVRFLDSGTYQNIMGISESISKMHKDKYSNMDDRADMVQRALKGRKEPSKLEERIISIIKDEGLPVTFTGNGDLMIKGENTICFPDFVVDGQPNKIIEVSRKHLTGDDRLHRKLEVYKHKGYKCFILFMTPDLPSNEQIAEMLWNFVTNGMTLVSKQKLTANLSHNHIQEYKVYNFHCEPYNNYVAQSIVTHNCGDGQPELIPNEVYEGCPSLLKNVKTSAYQNYGRWNVSMFPLYKLLSSGINALMRKEEYEAAYNLLRYVDTPMALYSSEDTRIAKMDIKNDFKTAVMDCDIIEYDNLALVMFYSKYRMSGYISSALQDSLKNKTVMAINKRNGSVSLRGDLATYYRDKLKPLDYLVVNGHTKFMGGKLTKNYNKLISDMDELL